MDRLKAMGVFVAVADALSFSEAASALRMTRPSVTRAITALEDEVGAQLLIRTTRRVSLSQAGERYLQDCRRILEAVHEAEEAARGVHAAPTGLLTVTAPVLFGRLHVLPVVRSLLSAHPGLQAHVLLLDRVARLVEEGIDAAVRIGNLPDSSDRAVRVGEVTPVVVGAPGYLGQHGTPSDPAELAAHTLIAHTARRRWRFQEGSREVHPRLQVNDAQAAVEAAAAGFGLTQVLSYQCGGEVASGALVRLLPEHEPEPLPVHLVVPASRRLPARARIFVDHAAERLRARAEGGWLSG